MAYQPKTGRPCSCKRGVERDNCPSCEGTGQVIDFAAIRARTATPRIQYECPNCHGITHAVGCPSGYESAGVSPMGESEVQQ